VAKLLYYWHFFGASNDNVSKVVVVDLESIHIR
jgi:hypothetical protein